MSFRDKLKSNFNANNTGFAIGYGSKIGSFNGYEKTGPLNMRETWLGSHTEWANTLGISPKNDNLSFNEADEIVFRPQDDLEVNLKDINTELQREGNGDLTVLGSSPFQQRLTGCLNTHKKEDYWKEGELKNERALEAGLKLINPLHASEIAKRKPLFYKIFDEGPGGVLPFVTFDEGMSNREAEENFIEEFENYGDSIDYILKPENGAGGKAQYRMGYDEATQKLSEKGAPVTPNGKGLFQTYIPLLGDMRVVSYEDEPIAAMFRRDNLSKVEATNHAEKALKAKNEGIVESKDVNQLEHEYHRMVAEGDQTIKDACDIDFDNAGLFMGWDIFITHRNLWEQENYPMSLWDDIIEYETDNGLGLIYGEVNNSPGAGIDFVNSDIPYQNTAANLLLAGERLSRDSEFKPLSEGSLYEGNRKTIEEFYGEDFGYI